MSAWTKEELTKIGNAEELDIASLREDGTLRKPVIIWVVRLGDELYVRSEKGRESAWFHGAQTKHAGRIRAGGVDKHVNFVEEPDLALGEQLDAAYKAKYRRYPSSLEHINSAEARKAAIRLVPQP